MLTKQEKYATLTTVIKKLIIRMNEASIEDIKNCLFCIFCILGWQCVFAALPDAAKRPCGNPHSDLGRMGIFSCIEYVSI